MNRTVKQGLKYGVSFQNRKSKAEKTYPIYLNVTFTGERVRIYTQCRCEKKEHLREGRVISGKNKENINIKLNDYENLVYDIFSTYDAYPTKKGFRADFEARIIKPVKPLSIYEIFDKYIDTATKTRSWSAKTITKNKILKSHLFDYNPDLTFHAITKDELLSFVKYLWEKDIFNETVKVYMVLFKSFLNWAKKEGYNQKDDYKDFELKYKGARAKKDIGLSQDELKKIYHVEIPAYKDYLNEARDIFIFLCVTGFRHGDAQNLCHSEVKEDVIEKVTQKTDQRVIIPLNDYSKAILRKYKGAKFPDNKVLPPISNLKLNRYVKELAQLAGLDETETIVKYRGDDTVTVTMPKYERITTHTGRHTFVTLASFLAMPEYVINKITGHTDESMQGKYRNIQTQTLIKEMQKFNDLLI